MLKLKRKNNHQDVQRKGRYLPKKKQKKLLWIAAAVLAAAAVLLLPRLWKDEQDQAVLNLTDTTVLARADLVDSIAATGTVESAQTTMVYSTTAYPVMAVHVEVGDYVEEGALLAELDDQTIRNQITSQEIGMDTAAQSSQQQLKSAQENYNNYKSGLEQGLNASLNSAQNQVDTAYDNYIKAKSTYERYLTGLNLGENTTLLNADAALRTAKSNLETAQDQFRTTLESYYDAQDTLTTAERELEQAEDALRSLQNQLDEAQRILDAMTAERRELLSTAEENRTEEQKARLTELETLLPEQEDKTAGLEQQISEKELEIEGVLGMGGLRPAYEEASAALEQLDAAVDSAEKALENAEAACDTQQATYNATVTTVDNTLADYLTNVENAWDTYQDAQTSLRATEKTTREQLQAYENNLASAQLGASQASSEESLRQLQESLEKTRVTAPCAGTVTAVYAEVGGSGSGLLFVIEDVDNLVVDTTIKGYDVGTVQTGMPVIIRSDATGDTELEGVVSSIAPTSQKNMQGLTNTTGEAVFDAEVEVLSGNSGLRIGMEAQLDYIVEQAEDVLAVPYDAVYENADGQTCVLAALEQENGGYLLQEYPVSTGMDDDLDMVIYGEAIAEGMRIIHAPDEYQAWIGKVVTVTTAARNPWLS